MKKFLFAAALIVGVVVSQLVAPSQAQAQEFYCYSETRGGTTGDNYLVTESIRYTNYGFKVQLHAVGKYDSYSKYWEADFTKKNGEWHVVWLPGDYTTPLSKDSLMRAVFNVAQQYM